MKHVMVVFILTVFGASGSWANETSLTIYSSNVGLVRQVRSVPMDGGEQILQFTDVAASLIPESVNLRLIEGEKTYYAREKSFHYDAVSPEKILAKTMGHPLDIMTGDGEYIQGILLNAYPNSLLIGVDDGVKLIPRNDELLMHVSNLPEALVVRPTIAWRVSGLRKGTGKVELSYLATGLQWEATYMAILNKSSERIELESWASLRNDSGVTFDKAQVRLIAGDVKRVPGQRGVVYAAKEARSMAAAKYDGRALAEQREFFEYHLFELRSPVTLKNNESKQFALRPRTTVETKKQFIYKPSQEAEKVGARILFKNEKKVGLGEPLPSGIVRVYQEDGNALVFLGEHRLPHRARSEEVAIPVGNAFDLTGERRVVDSRRVSERSERQSVTIELRNNKKKDAVTIMVQENLAHRNWRIEDSSHVYTRKDLRHIEFSIPVEANSKSRIAYTVLYSW